MSRIACVKGQFVPLRQAQVSMLDRGYQFADGIYEVVTLWNGRLVDEPEHLLRMERSLDALEIPMPMSARAIQIRIRELLRLHRLKNGLVYMQITRGEAMRNHLVTGIMTPVFTMCLLPARFPTLQEKTQGVRVITAPDQRWLRCDIKSIALLPNMLTRMASHRAKAKEAWQINAAGHITEGSLSNAYIVRADGVIQTHPADYAILGGIRREMVLRIAKENNMPLEEKPFTLTDVAKASEAFMSSASSFVLPITKVDEMSIGDGKVGPVTQQLMALYEAHVMAMPRVM